MDVVKRNVEHLGGRITVTSEPGKGCAFTLSLPLTLAVLDGMVVRTGAERFVIPTASVVETLKFDTRNVEWLPGGQTIMRRREQVAPLIGLGRLLGVPDDSSEEIIVLAETDLGRQIGLQVDEIIGQQQVVVKSLEASFGRVPGASAATILGDGRVALIVDVDGLPRLTGKPSPAPPFPRQCLETCMSFTFAPQDGGGQTGRPAVSSRSASMRAPSASMSGRCARSRAGRPPPPFPMRRCMCAACSTCAASSSPSMTARTDRPGLTEVSRGHVIVVVDHGERTLGLLVDSVSDIVDIPATAIRPPPDNDRPPAICSPASHCSTPRLSACSISPPFLKPRWRRLLPE